MSNIPSKELKICIENMLLRNDKNWGESLYQELKKEENNLNFEWLKDLILFVDAINSERR
ncbi:MAG: hypothetical protein HOH73_01205 [Alphaproteobacteria bacterium]|jgi:hypothetical protein|nr:hypothetical protein [Alphaproteobacteria bacterium]